MIRAVSSAMRGDNPRSIKMQAIASLYATVSLSDAAGRSRAHFPCWKSHHASDPARSPV